jgi:hypothetical protein
MKPVEARSAVPSRTLFSILVTGHVVLFIIFSHDAFSRHQGDLFIGVDGAYMLTLVAQQFVWVPIAAGFSANPFQALGDLWYNLNAWLLLGFVIPHFVLAQDIWGPAFRISSYTLFALELFGAPLIMARAIGVSWSAAMLAAWAAPLLLMPYFGTAAVYPILELAPQGATGMLGTVLILSATSRLGRNVAPGKGQALWRDALLLTIILGAAMHYALAYPATTILAAPLILFATIGSIFGAEGRREITIKLGGLGFVGAVLLLSGFAAFVMGTFSYSASAFWSSEFESLRQSWYYGSILFHEREYGPSGPLLFIVGVAGLIQAAAGTDRRLASLAIALLTFVLVLILSAALNTFVDFWPGPSPLYFEIMMWPLYVVFAARLITSAMSWCISRLLVKTLAAPPAPRATSSMGILWLAPLVILAFIAVHRGPVQMVGSQIWPIPGSDRPIVHTLKDEIGLKPGDLYRGRVVTLEALGKVGPVSWTDLHNLGGARAQATGNDYDTLGLWSNDIPTLLEYNPTMSPAFYRVATRLLARPGDKQVRNVVVLREANARLLGLLGVRFVIADQAEPPPFRLVQSERTTESEMLNLYEVPEVNLGTYSPTTVQSVTSFGEAINRLGDPALDPAHVAVVIGPPTPELSATALTAATNATIRMLPEGILVEATAAGASLLVLPFEFSRCLEARSRNPELAPPRLLRVDALETGVLFHDRIEVEIGYFTGPFDRASCRLRDAREFKRLVSASPEHPAGGDD